MRDLAYLALSFFFFWALNRIAADDRGPDGRRPIGEERPK